MSIVNSLKDLITNVTTMGGVKTNPEVMDYIEDEPSSNQSSNDNPPPINTAAINRGVEEAKKQANKMNAAIDGYDIAADKLNLPNTGDAGKFFGKVNTTANLASLGKNLWNENYSEACKDLFSIGMDILGNKLKNPLIKGLGTAEEFLGSNTIADYVCGTGKEKSNDQKENSSDQDGKTSSIPKADPISGNIFPWANDLFGFTTYDPLVINLDGSGVKTISYQDSQSIGVERSLQNYHLWDISGVCLARKFV